METAVAALIIISVILFGVLTLGQGYLATQEGMMQSWRAMEEQAGERARTGLVLTAASCTGVGDAVEITVRNAGSVKMADYGAWDVLLQYGAATGPVVRWYPFAAAAPGLNEWAVQGIYQDGAPEAYDPGILNPGEEMVIRVRVSPPVAAEGTGLVTVATANGVGATLAFAH